MKPNTPNYLDQLFNSYEEVSDQTTYATQNKTLDFSQHTILITGAAGTIGSALTNQLAASNVKKLIAVDVAESPLYNLSKALENTANNHITFALLDILDEDALLHIFKTHQPTLVFHTAAYKHVPLMENAPYNAVRVNILGTHRVANMAHTFKVQKFVFISTDKAVQASGVMGMSKKVVENYLHTLSKTSTTSFITARFGNIFGSNGSVVCQFKQQLALGLPLTITNTNIARYFISKQQATALILQIATYKSKGYTLYSFNMGQAIKIIDIAKKLLQRNHKNLEDHIRITGLRPGEKFSEILVAAHETIIPTAHKDIFEISTQTPCNNITDISVFETVKPHTAAHTIKALLKAHI